MQNETGRPTIRTACLVIVFLFLFNVNEAPYGIGVVFSFRPQPAEDGFMPQAKISPPRRVAAG